MDEERIKKKAFLKSLIGLTEEIASQLLSINDYTYTVDSVDDYAFTVVINYDSKHVYLTISNGVIENVYQSELSFISYA